jgi:hypothetical protein
MKTRSFNTLGSLHPILFMAALYVVTLLFAVFICSSLFYSCNASSAKPTTEENIKTDPQPNVLVSR